MEILVLVVIGACICGFLGRAVTAGDKGTAFMVGLLLGPLGVLIAALLKPSTKQEPKPRSWSTGFDGAADEGLCADCPYKPGPCLLEKCRMYDTAARL